MEEHTTVSRSRLTDRYELLDRIGSGGMGVVYRARFIPLDQHVAIKLLRSDLCEDAGMVERFRREAMIAAKIQHPHVVNIRDLGFDHERKSAFYVMELLAGEDLASTLRRQRRFPWRRVKSIARQVCDAVGAMHKLSVIHRDLKPSNCFLVANNGLGDFVKILDFGISKLVDCRTGALTRSGEILGTPRYMAPEYINGEVVDLRVDIYALGVILYQCLTGCSPYFGQHPLQLLHEMFTAGPPPLRAVAPDAQITPAIERLVATAMNADRELRYPSMEALAEDLNNIDDDGFETIAIPITSLSTSGMDEEAFSGLPTAIWPLPLSDAPALPEAVIPEPTARVDEPRPRRGRPLVFSLVFALSLAGVSLLWFADDWREHDSHVVGSEEEAARLEPEPEVELESGVRDGNEVEREPEREPELVVPQTLAPAPTSGLDSGSASLVTPLGSEAASSEVGPGVERREDAEPSGAVRVASTRGRARRIPPVTPAPETPEDAIAREELRREVKRHLTRFDREYVQARCRDVRAYAGESVRLELQIAKNGDIYAAKSKKWFNSAGGLRNCVINAILDESLELSLASDVEMSFHFGKSWAR